MLEDRYSVFVSDVHIPCLLLYPQTEPTMQISHSSLVLMINRELPQKHISFVTSIFQMVMNWLKKHLNWEHTNSTKLWRLARIFRSRCQSSRIFGYSFLYTTHYQWAPTDNHAPRDVTYGRASQSLRHHVRRQTELDTIFMNRCG